MTRELVPVGDELHLLDPATGETTPLATASDDLLGETLASIDERRRELADVRRALGDEAIRRMDSRALWTMTAGGRKITAPSSAPETTWDVEQLSRVLDELVTDGVIDREASLRALEQRVEFKPLARGLAALEKIPGVAERLSLCKVSVPRENRTVRLSRG